MKCVKVATSLQPQSPSLGLSFADQIMETKLRSERAKLRLLEAELPDENAKKYMRYEDMPPPTPEQEAEFDAEFRRILSELCDGDKDGDENGPGEGPEAG